MDLTLPLRDRRELLAAVAAVGLLAGCSSDTPFEIDEDAVTFPATVKEAFAVAEGVALDWSEKAYVARLGGEFTVLDAEGRGRNHSFTFYARNGTISEKLVVHILSGAPYTRDDRVPVPEPSFRDFDAIVDTDAAVAIAINEALAWNEANPDDALTIPDRFGARLLSLPVWPLVAAGGSTPREDLAWRIDFLVEDEGGDPPRLIWWSLGRVYLDPMSGQALGEPVIPPSGREAYTPTDFPPTGTL